MDRPEHTVVNGGFYLFRRNILSWVGRYHSGRVQLWLGAQACAQ